MSSGFLLADALAEALRRPYHQGDLNVTIRYLVGRLALGQYRVMLKRNFDTACWVPPVGKRSSHSIYYGDRMVQRVVERFCRIEELPVPPKAVFILEILAERKREYDVRLVKAAKEGKTLPPMPLDVGRSRVFDATIGWLKGNLPADKWDELLELIVQAVFAYGRHERQHARETPQDLQRVQKDLKLLAIPFSYFNLFEDARIEHISRDETGEEFGWNLFEDMAPADCAFNMLLRCIQLEEAEDREALDSVEPYRDGTRTLGQVAESVQGYYRRTIACTSAEHLYPIIQEFMEEFKAEIPPPKSPEGGEGGGEEGGGSGSGSATGSGKGKGEEDDGSGGGGGGDDDDESGDAEERAGDLTTAAEAASKGDSFFDEFEGDTEVVGGTDAEGKAADEQAKGKLKGSAPKGAPKSKGGASQGIPESITPTASGGRGQEQNFLARVPARMDEAYARRVENLTTTLMRMFKTKTLTTTTEDEGQRMSGRHLARGEIRFIKRQVFGGKGKRKFSIVYDCSSSMTMFGGKPDREGKLLLLALNNLARRGYLEGSLILSGFVAGKPSWLQYKFPVAESVILRIAPSHGSEGLQDSLKDNLQHIKGMDDVFVYTDANICDAPINKGFFAKQRIFPVGLYVGTEEAASKMEKHFPQNIIRDSIEDVVEAMLIRNRRTVG
ncbi:hypothetical protein AB4Y45_35050 [Paraburkholderia sp. EG287A]|uniref:hypothetical protein n=1 Tax=Paraburkholderia sp. EG287A TaxID=3237012 RepID=UPI0034D1909E